MPLVPRRLDTLFLVFVYGCGYLGVEPIERDASVDTSVDTSVDLDGNTDVLAPDAGVRVVSAVDAGNSHTCLISGGELFCFGANENSELGTGDQSNRFEPTRIGEESDWTHISAGSSHTCGIRRGGTFWCWGANPYGQLGVGDIASRSSPTLVSLPRPATELTTGGDHTCALLDDGQIACWGRSLEGCNGLGDGFTAEDVLSPAIVPDASGWTSVVAGQGHTLAIRGGALWGTGRNTGDQLGLGPDAASQYRSFTQILSQAPTALAAAQDGACVVVPPGNLQCWGRNVHGELGTGDTSIVDAPIQIGAESDWRLVGMNFASSCGVRTDGVYCVGRGIEGQLGGGNFDASLVWVRTLAVPADEVAALTVGRFHACVLVGGEVLCTGQNSSGQLGTAAPSLRNTWELVPVP